MCQLLEIKGQRYKDVTAYCDCNANDAICGHFGELAFAAVKHMDDMPLRGHWRRHVELSISITAGNVSTVLDGVDGVQHRDICFWSGNEADMNR